MRLLVGKAGGEGGKRGYLSRTTLNFLTTGGYEFLQQFPQLGLSHQDKIRHVLGVLQGRPPGRLGPRLVPGRNPSLNGCPAPRGQAHTKQVRTPELVHFRTMWAESAHLVKQSP